MAGEPSTGPASAYPTFSRPASICFTEPNDVLATGLALDRSTGFALLDCALVEPVTPSRAAAIAIAAVPRKRRRSWSISLDIDLPPIGFKVAKPELTPRRYAFRKINRSALMVSAS